MSKKQVIVIMMFAICVCISTSVFSAEENMIFCASFDTGVKADYAGGSAGGTAELELQEGVSGNAVVVGVEKKEGEEKRGYYCGYQGLNNVNLEEGTITFWVKSLDWYGKDGHVHLFFEAFGQDSRLTIYKYDVRDNPIGFIFGPPKQKDDTFIWTLTRCSVMDWEPGEWHHIACSWDFATAKLYIDGELKHSNKIKNFPTTPFTSFYVGGRNPKNWSNTGPGKSLIDELKIYNIAIDTEEIQEQWRKFSPSGSKKESNTPLIEQRRKLNTSAKKKRITPLISVGRIQQAPKIDGNIHDNEYSFKTTGFMGIWDQKYSAEQSDVHFAYDSDNLYIGIVSPVSGKLSSQVEGRDDVNIWQDDAVEVYLNLDPETDGFFQFIFNSAGTLYDSKNNDIKWSIDFPYSNQVSPDIWTLEMAIPFEKLGIRVPEEKEHWRINICRSFSSSGTYTSISPVRRNYCDIPRFADLKFLKESPVVKLTSIGDLVSGDLSFELFLINSGLNPQDVEVSVNLETGKKTFLDYNKKLVLEKGAEIRIPLSRKSIEGEGRFKVEISSSQKGELYSAILPFSTVTENPLKLSYLYTIPRQNVIKLGLLQSELSRFGKPLAVRVRFLDDKKKVALEKSFQKSIRRYELEMDIRQLPPANYEMEISLTSPDGREISTLREAYTRYSSPTPWEGNQIGITDKVPLPWTPLKMSKDSVICWGREYCFENSLLPSQIVSQKKELLVSPIRLVALKHGKEIEPVKAEISWKEKSESKVNLLTEGSLDSIKLSADIVIEYDGFMWVTLRLTPSSPTKIDRLILEIPLKKRYATLVNSGHGYLEQTGAFPMQGWHKNLKTESPIFWVGNEEMGLQWFAEDLSGWYVKDPGHSAEIVSQGDKVIAQLSIIDTPLILKETRTVSFGFMATPVRPKPEGWRKWRISGTGVKRNISFMDLSVTYLITPLFNYPELQDRENLVNIFNDHKTRGIKTCAYFSLAVSSPFSPEFKYEGQWWRRLPGAGAVQWDSKMKDRRDLFVNICPESSSYRDFYLWKLSKVVRDLDLEGLYFDFGESHTCQNKLHGCGWRDEEGTICPTFNILGTRELTKRIYVMMKEHDPNSLIVYHMSGKVEMPVHSFADIMYDGEQLTRKVGKEESYYNILPLDKFRAEYMPHQWGPITTFLPEFTRSAQLFNPERLKFWWTKEAAKPINHLIGLVLVHDSKCFSGNIAPYLGKVREIQDEFGWDEQVEFIPYWNNSQYVKMLSPESTDIVVSLFKRPGAVMLIPFNNTDKNIKLKLRVDFDKLNVSGGDVIHLIDKLTNEKFSIGEGNTLEIPVDSRAFRMLVIRR